MQTSDFPRILTLLRKEKKISQKSAAEALGVSQSLLSHYEKGVRECGLVFLVRAADYYGVTVDYLLGRSYDKNGMTISVDDIPESEKLGKSNVGIKSMMPTLNKKLICNSVSVLMDVFAQLNDKTITTEASSYLSLAVYQIFRLLYDSNSENSQDLFGTDSEMSSFMIDSSMKKSLSKIYKALPQGAETLKLDLETIKEKYPDSSASLMNLLQNCENKIGARKR